MIYPDNFEKKIGFDAIRGMVKEKCQSSLGSNCVDEMSFSPSYSVVERELGRVEEFRKILTSGENFPGGAIKDVTARLAGIRPEGTYLTSGELVDLGTTLATMSDIESFFRTHRDDDGQSPFPLLDELSKDLKLFPALARAIGEKIDRWGNIKDTASPELAAIRSSLTRMSGMINSVMRRVIAAAVRDGLLDADVTASVRDGRLVIPVAPMNKRRIPGIVHDESASGKTVFIEPAEVVEANNRLRELQLEEQREEIRILIAIASEIRPCIDEILASFALLGIYDFIRAKALWAIEIDASMPFLSKNPELEWYHAFHPVLQQSLRGKGREVVPLDITLSADRRILVVSGPNAGGKSVTLKTVAVTQYMAQCGLLPPLYDNSHMGVFEKIFIDIGDDQSIEDDLSTYSSHLRNMKFFISRGDSRTLFLIDEFGAGTEPQIGGAIAQAILAEFNERQMWGVVTTHFQNLKKFAGDTPGLVNGSMLYERREMRPLFILSIGQPGSSFAIEIARKIGLPDTIIKSAGEIVGSDYLNLDKYLLDIARDRRYWENKRQQIRQKEKKIEETLDRYETDAETLRAKRREIIDDARQEAKKILEGSNAAIEKTIHEIRQSQAERKATLEARKALDEEKKRLGGEADTDHPLIEKAARRNGKKKQARKETVQDAAKRELKVGDNVLLDGAGTPGTIEEIRGKEAVVIFGNLKTTVKLDRLTYTIKKASGATRKPLVSSVVASNESRERQLRFSQEIDVRGMRVDEAVQAVTYFIDDAVQFNASRVRILHGTGTGALRQYIREYLATVPSVIRFGDEDVRFGGAGITVVEL